MDDRVVASRAAAPSWPASEIGRQYARTDWTAAGLGPPEAWSPLLVSTVALLLRSRFPMFVIWGPKRILLYNAAYAPILGDKHPSALGRPFWSVWSEVREQIEPVIDAAFAGEESFFEDLEVTLYRGDGAEQTWFTFSYSPLVDANGAIPGVHCVCIETTATVLANAATREAQQRQHRMFEQAPGFICILQGPDHVFEFVNQAYERLFGDRAYVGKPVRDAFPELAGQGYYELMDAVYRSGERHRARATPAQLQHPDGHIESLFLDFVYEPIHDAQGRVSGIFCEGFDVTSEVRQRLARDRDEARLRFLDGLSEAVRPLVHADEILASTTRMVGEHLGISCCAYADMDDDEDGFTIRGDWSAPGAPSIVGHYSLADFGKLAVKNLSAGQPLVVNDNLRELAPEEAKTFQDIGIAATICMPLVKDGRLTALMAIHDRQPHVWSDDELVLIREVTERSWAHVARVAAEAELRESEEQLRLATDAAEVGLWDVDPLSDTLYWPARVKAMFGISPDAPVSMSEDFFPCLHPEDRGRVAAAWEATVDPQQRAAYDVEYRTIGKEDQVVRWVAARGRGLFDSQGACYRVIGTAVDVTARKRAEREAVEQARSLQVLNTTGAALAAELDLQKVVQLVTDAGVGITGAQFGAFFYNLLDEAGESYMLYSLSGVDRANFDKFPMPRNTEVFAPTFNGEGVVRSDDITQDPRYGRNTPRKGMPEGHLPVRSYLAVPVVSRSGEVIGGLFFGHAERGVFTAGAEHLVRGVAGQAAVAIDNARLYQAAQREIDQRRKVEEQQLLLINELNHRVKNTLATVQSIVAQTSRSGRSAEEVRAATEGRLLALSAAHDLLTRHNWEGADLRDVVQRATAPFLADGERRIAVEGPSVPLSPQQALAISMALHELATNATKYGALSVPSGRVSLDWRTADDRLALSWREHGGPPVSRPANPGFGSRLLERGLARDLRGTVKLDFAPDGLNCAIEAPLAPATGAQPLLDPSLH